MPEKDTSFRWHYWSVTAPKEKLLELIEVLNSALPEGWRAVARNEMPSEQIPMIPSPDDVAFYRLDARTGWSGVTLSLDIRRGTELRGGQMLATFPSSPIERGNTRFAGADVSRFLDDGLIPAAKRLGLSVRRGTIADMFFDELSWEVRDRLTAFDASARKSLPLSWEESEAWQAFVVAAHRSGGIVDREYMRSWLGARGWPESNADELTAQFFEQCRLLDRYRETLVIA